MNFVLFYFCIKHSKRTTKNYLDNLCIEPNRPIRSIWVKVTVENVCLHETQRSFNSMYEFRNNIYIYAFGGLSHPTYNNTKSIADAQRRVIARTCNNTPSLSRIYIYSIYRPTKSHNSCCSKNGKSADSTLYICTRYESSTQYIYVYMRWRCWVIVMKHNWRRWNDALGPKTQLLCLHDVRRFVRAGISHACFLNELQVKYSHKCGLHLLVLYINSKKPPPPETLY